MENKISVWGIYEKAGKYCRVSVSSQLFKELTSRTNILPFTTSKDAKERPIKVYNVDGTKIFTRDIAQSNDDGTPMTQTGTDGKEYPVVKTSVYMTIEDAEKFLTNKPDEVEKYEISID